MGEHVEPGASAKDDNRPQFRRMIEAALSADRPFDAIVVHSMSRFFRDEVHGTLYIRKLAGAGVVVLSATEAFGQGMAGEMAQRLLGMLAEFENRQRAVRVKETMAENARQGFWNGGPAPYGYRSAVAEMRGATAKKRLEANPPEAEIVRLIYRLALHGDGDGPLGVKGIVDHLNRKGLRYRKGRPFRVGEVHRILTRSTTMGVHHHGRRKDRPDRLNPPETWIAVSVPALVEPPVWEAVQQHLRGRRPTVTPPRVVNAAMLLAGLARCPHCGRAMTLSTGKSGRYRYYACAGKATMGEAACRGRRMRADMLDDLVLSALEQRILAPERLPDLLQAVAQRVLEHQGKAGEQELALRRELRETDTKLKRLYDAVAEGKVPDGDLFKRAVTERLERRDQLLRLVAHNRRRAEVPQGLLRPANVSRFAAGLRARLRDPRAGLRRAYVRLLVDRVVVGERQVEISGSKAALLGAAAAGEKLADGEVPGFIQEWRSRTYHITNRLRFAGRVN